MSKNEQQTLQCLIFKKEARMKNHRISLIDADIFAYFEL